MRSSYEETFQSPENKPHLECQWKIANRIATCSWLALCCKSFFICSIWDRFVLNRSTAASNSALSPPSLLQRSSSFATFWPSSATSLQHEHSDNKAYSCSHTFYIFSFNFRFTLDFTCSAKCICAYVIGTQLFKANSNWTKTLQNLSSQTHNENEIL